MAEHRLIPVMKKDAPWLFALCLLRIPPLPSLTHTHTLTIFFIPPRLAAVMSSAARPPHPNPSLLSHALSILCACAHVCHKSCTKPQSLSEFSPMPSPAVVPGSVGGSTPLSPEVSAAGGARGGLTMKSPVPKPRSDGAIAVERWCPSRSVVLVSK